MRGERRREQLLGHRRQRGDQRTTIEPRLARKPRDDDVAALRHLVGDSERHCVLGFPWIVADEAEQDPGRAQQYEAELLPCAQRSRRRNRRRVHRFRNVGAWRAHGVGFCADFE
jgi:hypothetical protein